ncbi:hypothetical protein IGB42_03010 [Andreprevotia sp. IGB-42]|nr:hypothetical protein IGB42_03010 [Andreprevotia sp. IGB-42]
MTTDRRPAMRQIAPEPEAPARSPIMQGIYDKWLASPDRGSVPYDQFARKELVEMQRAKLPARTIMGTIGDAAASFGEGTNRMGKMINSIGGLLADTVDNTAVGGYSLGRLKQAVAPDLYNFTKGMLQSVGRVLDDQHEQIREFKSPRQQAAEQPASEAKTPGEWLIAMKENPSAIANLVGNQLPQFGVMGKLMQTAGKGLQGAAAIRNMTMANVGANTVLGAADAGSSAEQAALDAGATPEQAKAAGKRAALIAAPISAAASLLGAGTEARLINKIVGGEAAKLTAGQLAKQVPLSILKEVGEEALDEGGGQFAQNAGAKLTYDPSRDLS